MDEITAIAALVGGVIFAALSIFLRRKKGTVVEDNSATLEAHEEKIAEHKAEANVLKAENEVLNAKVDAIAAGLAKDLEEADADAKKAGHAADDDPARALADAFNSASE